MDYNYISVSESGQKRKQNEDSVGIFKTDFGLLIIICDGLGGGPAGEFASKSSVEKIYKNFITSKEKDLLKRIRKSIEKTNKYVYEKSNGNLTFKGMATTSEVLLLNGTYSIWGHIGDSRIYLHKNKKLKQLTKDHSLIQQLLDEGKLNIKTLKNHPSKSVITNAIGDNIIPDVDISKIVLPPSEPFKFFVCTDGVTCVVTDAELEKCLELSNIEKASERLKGLIEKRGAPDNYSFVIVSK
jgi:protein phosphatase